MSDLDLLEQDINTRLSQLKDFSTDSLRKLRKEFSKVLVDVNASATLNLAFRLLDKRLAPRFFVYELVQHHPKASQSLNAGKLRRLGDGISSWGETDAFACYLSGPAWRDHLVTDAEIFSWGRSKDRWWRRAAVVSTVPLNNKTRGGSGDVSRTLQVCRLVLNDRDDMVVNAVSWALRELSKRDAATVKDFLNENRHVLPARVIREVTSKIETGVKNRKKSLKNRSR